MILEDALNLDTLKGLVRFLQRIFKGTFMVESIGAVCYSLVFIPQYGIIKGVWFSIFHSVSAFCNAGIDILGENSLVPTTDWNRLACIFSKKLRFPIVSGLLNSSAKISNAPPNTRHKVVIITILEGGIKTTTFSVLFLSTRATIKGSPHLVVFNKTIPHKTVKVIIILPAIPIDAVKSLESPTVATALVVSNVASSNEPPSKR